MGVLMGNEIQITGIKETDRAIQELGKNISKKIMRKAMRESLKPVQQACKQNAPVDKGDLRKAIKIKAMKKSRKGFGVKVEIGEGDFKGDTFYGAFQEYGWKTGKRGSENRHEIKGKGFMRKSFDETKESAKEDALNKIKIGIEAEANRLRNK